MLFCENCASVSRVSYGPPICSNLTVISLHYFVNDASGSMSKALEMTRTFPASFVGCAMEPCGIVLTRVYFSERNISLSAFEGFLSIHKLCYFLSTSAHVFKDNFFIY